MAAMNDMLTKMLGISPEQIASMGKEAQQLAQFVVGKLNAIDKKQDEIIALLRGDKPVETLLIEGNANDGNNGDGFRADNGATFN